MKIYAENKKVYYNYEILEKFEAGLVLIGTEVKSIKSGRVNIQGSYIIIKDQEAYLIGAKIPAYQPKNAPADYNSERNRKLLLKKSEIKYLLGKSQTKGLTLIPLKIFDKNAKIKMEFAIGKGKKKWDKREKIRKKDIEREISRQLRKS